MLFIPMECDDVEIEDEKSEYIPDVEDDQDVADEVDGAVAAP